jgi:hypothetical protein
MTQQNIPSTHLLQGQREMKTWKKVGILTLLVLLVASLRLYFVWRARNTPMVVQKKSYQEWVPTSDEVVPIRKMYIDDIKSARTLIGKPVWIKAGFEIAYFPYVAHHVDFAHKTGVLPSIARLEIKDVVQQAAPMEVQDQIPHGTKQILLVFEKADDPKQYAMPVGYAKGNDLTFYCDELFYYDDPHSMYKHWPGNIWQAVDAHQAKAGMSELQVTMALGNMQQSNSSDLGNRTVHYNTDGKQWMVTFAQNKATEVKQE